MSNFDKTIKGILQDAGSGRAGGRDKLFVDKDQFLDPETCGHLQEQWQSAGRDNARVYAKLLDENDSPYYLTGWDGHRTYVCYTESGLRYINHRKIQNYKLDEEWDDNTLLIHVRAPILKEEMERGDVDALLSRVRRNLIKSGKKRRRGRLKTMEKYFQISEAAQKALGPPSETLPVEAPGYVHGAPEEAPQESDGETKGAGPEHPKHADETKNREKVTVRHEQKFTFRNEQKMVEKPSAVAGDSEQKGRELVTTRSEGGDRRPPYGPGPAPHAKSTDPGELQRRELITMRHEERDAGDHPYPDRGYWGGQTKDHERKSRENVSVRQEAKDSKEGLMKAKKPLVLMMLMHKKKMAEAYEKMKRPSEETARSEVDSRQNEESLSRNRQFKLAEAFPKEHAHKFLANIKRAKDKAKAKQGDDSDYDSKD